MDSRFFGAFALCCLALLLGCGSQSCQYTGFAMSVGPQDPSAAPDHTLAPPGNQQQFLAGVGSEVGQNCSFSHLYKFTNASWTVSDPTDVTISSANDSTNGLATCVNATPVGGATVTATLSAYGFTETQSSTVNINCK